MTHTAVYLILLASVLLTANCEVLIKVEGKTGQTNLKDCSPICGQAFWCLDGECVQMLDHMPATGGVYQGDAGDAPTEDLEREDMQGVAGEEIEIGDDY